MKNLILIFMSLILVVSCSPKKVDETKKLDLEKVTSKEAFPVEAVIAKKGEVNSKITGSILTEGIKEITISAKSSGTIISSKLKLGQYVSKGTSLCRIENYVQKAAFDQSKVSLSQSQLTFDASEKLYNKSSISESEYISAKSGLSAAKSSFEMNRQNYLNTWVKAPFSGVITSVEPSIEVGNLISVGTPVARLVDISKLKMSLYVGEDEVVKCSKGNKVNLYVQSVDINISGEVIAVSQGADRSTGAFEIKFVTNNPKRAIKSGMVGDVSIESDSTYSGILLPSKSIKNEGGKETLMISRKGLAIMTTITSQSLRSGKSIVWGELSDGDTVITTGLTELMDGDSVALSLVDHN